MSDKNKSKEAYLKKVEADIRKKQEESNKKEWVHRMSYGLTAKDNPEKKSAIINEDLKRKNEVELREALKKASEKFDKNTKYDELLGRSTNPDKKYEDGGIVKAKKGKKKKKPNYGKTETFADYKSAAAAFADYNPQSDTVFVGSSIDPGVAQSKANRSSNISASKGASSVNYNDQKVYRTKNEAGQTVYVHLKKHDKKEYSKGGTVKTKKQYKTGGKLKGKTVTKEMADKEYDKKFKESANFANNFAKYAETGVGPNGMPLSDKKRKEYASLAKSEKSQSSKMKPNYKYVGTKLPSKDQPVYKNGGVVKAKKKYSDGGKVTPKQQLESMTKSRLMQALKDAGVGVPYGSDPGKGARKEKAADTGFKSGVDYTLAQLTKMAKAKGVYEDARAKAVADFRKKYGSVSK